MKVNITSEANNQFVCADDNVVPGMRVLAANRPSAGIWETFYLGGIEYTTAELQSLAAQLQPYLVTTPTPGPTPPTPGPFDPAQVPYQVAATGLYNLATKDGCCAFTEECARRLHAGDPGWGHIKKNPGQEQCAGTQPTPHAVDAVFNKNIPEARDIIVSSGVPGAAPGWNITGTPTADLWVAPV
jgi:hypothetical protein